MTRFVAPKRGSLSNKKLDLSRVRNIFADGRTWTTVGIVQSPDNGSHFSVEDDDVIIEVITQPDLLPLSCRLLACSGVWLVPAAGEEVGVIIPAGDIGFMPLAIPMLSTGVVPDNVGEQAIVIARQKVYIHDGTNSGTEPVAKLSELNALREAYNAHTHITAVGASSPPSALTQSDLVPNPNYPAPDPLYQFLPKPADAPADSVGAYSGTAVLEAK